MSIIVRSFDRFDEAAAFDPAAASSAPAHGSAPCPRDGPPPVTTASWTASPSCSTARPAACACGWERDVAVDGHVEIRHERSSDRCRLTVGATTLTYPAPDTLLDPADDPTPFAEAEDFDLGLFAANVAGDARRRDAVYR
ncbi:hypothetical protein ACFQ2B_34635 [Streptomyces stramineus]